MKWRGIIFLLLLGTGCGGNYTLSLEDSKINRSPQLKVEMQQISNSSEGSESIYQEIGDAEDLDTLIIASEYLQETSLSAYVQKAINQLKNTGYLLSNEKSQKIKIQGEGSLHSTVLKTYDLSLDKKKLSVAQLFFEQEGNVNILSYASTNSSHTKTFTEQLKTLQFSF